jgi:hypothetical protein
MADAYVSTHGPNAMYLSTLQIILDALKLKEYKKFRRAKIFRR